MYAGTILAHVNTSYSMLGNTGSQCACEPGKSILCKGSTLKQVIKTSFPWGNACPSQKAHALVSHKTDGSVHGLSCQPIARAVLISDIHTTDVNLSNTNKTPCTFG